MQSNPLISVIVCSRSRELPVEFVSNIRETIGVSFEIIAIDNSSNKKSIFSAYEEGTAKAKGEILCFVHEDVIFRSNDWGNELVDKFKDASVGLIGLIGTHFLPKVRSAWWYPETYAGKILQGITLNEEYNVYFTDCSSSETTTSNNVVSVDGVFLALPASMFQRVSWDTTTFHGFHAYDIDICLQVLRAGYDVCVADSILIEHKSKGNKDYNFIKALDVLFEKWESFLPVCRGIELTAGEVTAWTEVARLKYRIDKYEKSKELILGNAILHPTIVLQRRVKVFWNRLFQKRH